MISIKSCLTQFSKLVRRNLYKAVDVADLPVTLVEEEVYVVGESKHKWLAALVCPCGCEEIILLNLLQDAEPCWQVRIRKNQRITLTPSIWRTKGCRSHFKIINGKLEWY